MKPLSFQLTFNTMLKYSRLFVKTQSKLGMFTGHGDMPLHTEPTERIKTPVTGVQIISQDMKN